MQQADCQKEKVSFRKEKSRSLQRDFFVSTSLFRFKTIPTADMAHQQPLTYSY